MPKRSFKPNASPDARKTNGKATSSRQCDSPSPIRDDAETLTLTQSPQRLQPIKPNNTSRSLRSASAVSVSSGSSCSSPRSGSVSGSSPNKQRSSSSSADESTDTAQSESASMADDSSSNVSIRSGGLYTNIAQSRLANNRRRRERRRRHSLGDLSTSSEIASIDGSVMDAAASEIKSAGCHAENGVEADGGVVTSVDDFDLDAYRLSSRKNVTNHDIANSQTIARPYTSSFSNGTYRPTLNRQPTAPVPPPNELHIINNVSASLSTTVSGLLSTSTIASSGSLLQTTLLQIATSPASTLITHINLSGRRLIDSDVEVLIETLVSRRIRSLNLTLTTFSDKHAAVFAEKFLSTNTTLRELELSHTLITVDGVESVLRALGQNASSGLKHLGLDGNRLGSGSGPVFSQFLINNTSLESLSLALNDIDESSISQMVHSISKARYPVLTSLNLYDNYILPAEHFTQLIKHNKVLEHLNIQSRNDLLLSDLKTIYDALLVNTSLQSLVVGFVPYLTNRPDGAEYWSVLENVQGLLMRNQDLKQNVHAAAVNVLRASRALLLVNGFVTVGLDGKMDGTVQPRAGVIGNGTTIPHFNSSSTATSSSHLRHESGHAHKPKRTKTSHHHHHRHHHRALIWKSLPKDGSIPFLALPLEIAESIIEELDPRGCLTRTQLVAILDYGGQRDTLVNVELYEGGEEEEDGGRLGATKKAFLKSVGCWNAVKIV